MDAFESIVAKILERDGYWVKQSVKIENLTIKEKQTIGGTTIPTPEVDLVAYREGECILFEVKSFLDSTGVRLSGIDGSSEQNRKKYKILNDPIFQELIKQKIKIAFELPDHTTIKFGLAAGNIAKKDKEGIAEYFGKRPNYVLLTPEYIADKLVRLGDGVYINDEVTMTVKLLTNQRKIKET